MSAESYGAGLLGEVKDGTANDAVSEIRQSCLPDQADVLGVPALDKLLEIFRYEPNQPSPQHHGSTSPQSPNNYSSSLYDRQNTTAPATPTISTRKLKNAVIELTSTKSSAGKTNLLYLLTAISVLPKTFIRSNSRRTCIIWIDTDGRYSSRRLHQVILNTIPPHVGTDLREQWAKEALEHVHVYRPISSPHLDEILRTIPAWLEDNGCRYTTDYRSEIRNLGLIVLDSATAFQCQDRFDSEMERLEYVHPFHPPPTLPPSRTATIIMGLKAIQLRFHCAVIYTTSPTPVRNLPNSNAPSISPWTSLAALTLILDRVAVPKFAATMTTEECARDQPKRLDAVSKGRFRASVDTSTNDTWATGVREAVASLDGKGSVGFRVTDRGVEFE